MIQNLVPNNLDHLERLQRGDAVDEHVAMDADEVLRVEDAVLVLARCVDDLGRVVLSLIPDLLAERVLDGRVVALDKVAVDITHCEGGFAWEEQNSVNHWVGMREKKGEGGGGQRTD